MKDTNLMSPPALTRMLLASDGSTTHLLEALLGAPLVIRVEQQRQMPASGLPRHIRDALTVSPCDTVINGDPSCCRRTAVWCRSTMW